MESGPVLYIRFDRDGRIHEMNAFASSHASGPEKPATIERFFIHFTDLPDMSQLLDPDRMPHRLTIQTQSGLPQTVYFHFHLCADFVHGFGHMDVDEMEFMRKEILGLNNELSNLNRELHKKKAQLEHLNQLKNRFLGMATHDLRHPISTIQMYSEFLADELKGRIDDEHAEFIEIIRSSSEGMNRLVSDYLDVVKIESGRLHMAPEMSDITALVDTCATQHRTLAAVKRVAVKWNPQTSSVSIPFDPAKMRQVLDNLLHNAVKFTPPGGTVEIALERVRSSVVVSVADTGVGMPEDRLHVIFEPFEQAAASRKKKEQGVGLGLAIAKKIVAAHGGRIRVESRPGKGSTFYVSLPYENRTTESDPTP